MKSDINPVIMESIDSDIFKPLAAKLTDMFESERLNRLDTYHTVGKLIAETEVQIITKYSRPYGANLIERLGEKTGICRRNLYFALRFVKRYSDADLQRLRDTPAISWSHLKLLLAIDDRRQRRRLEKQVADERLTVEALHDVIRALHAAATEKPERSSQPVPRPPATAKQGLADLRTAAEAYTRRTTTRLFGEEYDLAKELRALPDHQVDDQLCGQLADVIAAYDAIQTDAAQQADALRAALATAQQLVANRQEIERRVAAGEDSAAVVRELTSGGKIQLPPMVAAMRASADATL